MKKSRSHVGSVIAIGAGLVWIPAIALANTYNDVGGLGDQTGTPGPEEDLSSVNITDTQYDLVMAVNLNPAANLNNYTTGQAYQEYMIGIQSGASGTGDTNILDAYGYSAVGSSKGLNYFVETYLYNGPNYQLYQYTGGAYSEVAGVGTTQQTPGGQDTFNPVISTAPGTTPGNGNVLTYYLPLYAWSGATGIANQSAATFNGVTFSFDVYTTFSGSESAYDALSSGASVTQAAGYAPWNNTPYDSGLQPGYAAQTYTLLNWNNTGTGGGAGTTWNASTNNWGGGGTAPVAYADGDNVLFADNNNGHYNITLNSTVSPSSVVFGNSAGNYVISGSGGIAGTGFLTVNGTGSVTLSTANSYSGGTNVNSGTLIIAAPGSLPNLGNVSIGATGELKLGTGVGGSNLNTLSITTGGILDVGNNHVYVADPGGLAHDSTYTTILGEIQNGLYNGSNGYTSAAGGAILSSAGFTSPNYGIGLVDGNDGVHNTLVSANEIEVAYTLEGDANLDGKVDASDFSIFAPNFGLNTTLGWEAGDFNYDGKVDASDFSAFAPNFGLQDNGVALGLPAADYAALDAFAAANGLTITSVPEPATLGLLTIGAVGILSRRRRANH